MKIDEFRIHIKNTFDICLKLFIILLSINLSYQQSNNYDFLTAMQQTDETFMAYLPFIQNCNYTNNNNISSGSISFQTATTQSFFLYYQNAEKIAFWSSIKDGLDIISQQSVLLTNYNGIIYKPQIFNQDENNISQNSTNDVVTLFQNFADGNLTLFFVEVYVDKNNNFTIQQTILQENKINLSDPIKKFTQTCYTNKQKIVISQLDASYYIGTCLNSSSVFFFSLNSSFTQTILDLSSYNMSMPINNMILNPILEIEGVSQIGWNVFLLTNGSQQTYSCDFDPLNPTSFTKLNSSQFSQQFQQLIQKLWSQQTNLLQIKIEKLISHIGPNATQKFPGKIDSIYIDFNDNVYVQSINDQNMTFLNVFNWQKVQILNTSFVGRVLLYNQLQFLINNYGNQSNFAIMTVTLPMINFGFDQVNNSSYTVNVPCSDSINNLTMKYRLFISNIDYPTAYTYQIAQPNLYSNLSIYTFQLFQYFTVFGPGYSVYFRGTNGLQATFLDASIISMSTYVLSIVEIIVAQSTANTIFRSSSLTYTTENEVYVYSGEKDIHKKIMSKPCGISFNLKGQTLSKSQTLYYGYADDDRIQLIYCMCPKNRFRVKNCNTIGHQKLRRKITIKEQKLSLKLQKLTKLGLLSEQKNLDDLQDINQGLNPNFISNRLFTIVDQSLVITLFNNNSAVLSNFWTRQFYDIVTYQCNNLQQLVGIIFVKSFYDPSLNLFCQEGQFVYQYKIRNNKLLFQRSIPLYGFLTRQGSSNILVGSNYIFIEVQVNQSPQDNTTVNANSKRDNCCVLRIDPFVDTVSAIKQVIFARSVKQVYKYSGIDVAYYQGSTVTQDDSFLKIYLDETWMALNQTYAQSSIQTFSFEVVFASINYNLASRFAVNITYNMTSMEYIQQTEPLPRTIYLQSIISQLLHSAYSSTFNFNYNGIQGPILSSNISTSDTPQTIQDIQLNELIVQRKILGTVGNTYLKIFTPLQGKSKTTFDNAIIVIGSQQVEVYLKNFNNQQMFHVSTFALKYQNCEYFTYKILNSTSMQFVSQCQVPQFQLQIPILVLNLTIVNQTNATLGASLELGNVNIRLSNMKTIVFQNATYVFGVDEGPMQSLTGKLRYCSNTGICSILYTSSKQYFLLDYDIFTYADNQFIVVTLDFQYIEVWINPLLPINNSTNNPILYNFTIYLPNFINQDISIISLINGTYDSFSAILSGTQAYYQVIFNYTTQILTVLTIFQRYSNCQQFDRFSLNILLDNNGRVQAMIAQCNQNQAILRLQTYERIDSTSVVIFTGYLQFFSRYGPSSYLSTNSIPAFNPIKILQLSNTMLYKLFLLYKNQKDQIKLVYQQIDGILADNYVYLQPSISITLSPLTTNLNFPTLKFTIQNDIYQLNYTINTKPAPLNNLTTSEFGFLILFIVCNAFNVIVMIFYWIYYRQKQPKKVVQRESIVAKSWADEDQTHNTFKDFKVKIKQRLSGLSILSRSKTQTRKQTQIQLFTKRYD